MVSHEGNQLSTTQVSEWRQHQRRARLEAGTESEGYGNNQEREDNSLVTIQVPPMFHTLCQHWGSNSPCSQRTYETEKGK